ncbi:MAG: hypothetical protein ACK44M_12975, partial [Chloroflexus sp.]
MHDYDRENEQSLLAAAALGSLDPADLAALEQLLNTSPTARAELHQLRETVALLPYAVAPATPPAHVRARLMERIAADQAQRAPVTRPASSRRTGWLAPAMVTILAVVVLFLGGLTVSLQGQVATLAETNQQLAAAVQAEQWALFLIDSDPHLLRPRISMERFPGEIHSLPREESLAGRALCQNGKAVVCSLPQVD